MALRLQLLLATLLVLVVGAASTAAHPPRAGHAVVTHEEGRSVRREPAPAPEVLAKARAKWDTLSNERRAELVAAWEKLQRLSPEERAKLVERAERLKRMREELAQRLSPEERERFAMMPEGAREHALRGMVHAAGRERGARLKERLPEGWRAELESSTPEQRAGRMARFHDGLADRGLRLVLDKCAERLALPRAEFERLQALPADQREREARVLLARLTPEDARKLGWKADTLEERAAIQSMPIKDLAAAYMSSRLERDLRAKGLGEERVQALLGLARDLEPRQVDWTALRQLPEAERRAALEERRRTQALAALERSGLLPAERLAALAALRGPEAASELRRLLDELGLAQRRGPRGRGGPEGREHEHGSRTPGERGSWDHAPDGRTRGGREGAPGAERRREEGARTPPGASGGP